MGSEGMEKFFKFLAENPENQAKVQSFGSGGGDMDALAAYARELGYEVSPEELREYQENALRVLKGRLQKARRPDAPLSPGAREFYALIKLAETDESVAGRLAELAAGTSMELIAYGREKGFIFDEQDMQAIGKDILEPSDELSDEELELAAGGTTVLLFVGILAFGAFALGTAGVAVAVAFAVSKKKD